MKAYPHHGPLLPVMFTATVQCPIPMAGPHRTGRQKEWGVSTPLPTKKETLGKTCQSAVLLFRVRANNAQCCAKSDHQDNTQGISAVATAG